MSLVGSWINDGDSAFIDGGGDGETGMTWRDGRSLIGGSMVD